MMHIPADKTQENKSQSAANRLPELHSGSVPTFQFVDNRPEATAQRKLQEMANNSPQVKQATQLKAIADGYSSRHQPSIQRKENNTGLPDNLKSGIENLSGYSMDDVEVHYNSDKPAQLQAHAYAQGTDIHLASGQEKHLPHEAWHVVQQKQGRVKPTIQMKGKVDVNDDAGLEKEADVMGKRAVNSTIIVQPKLAHPIQTSGNTAFPIQRRPIHSAFHGDFNSEDLELEELQAIASQLERINGDRYTISQIQKAIAAGEYQGGGVARGGHELGAMHRSGGPASSSHYEPSEWDDSDEALLLQLSPEALFGRVKAEVEEMQQVARATVMLPPVVVDPNYLKETKRQIQMQLSGLNQLSAKEWLINVLLNRMKPPEEQISEGYGTREGKSLAQKIDKLLVDSDALASLLMQGIIDRMNALLPVVSKLPHAGDTLKLVQEIIKAATNAKGAKNTYMVFRSLHGQENMQALTRIGLIGGLGRQHGAGDEKDFRKRYSAGIELLKAGDPVMAKNACLHNPDQCAGGPLEITWLPESIGRLDTAQANYHEALSAFTRQAGLVESYKRSPPKTSTGDPDVATMKAAEEQLTFNRSRLRETTLGYMSAVSRHLGNYDVSSQLGQAWMESIGNPSHINRIDMILNTVLHIPLHQLDNAQLDVRMGAVEDEFGRFHSREFDGPHIPDVFSGSAPKDTAVAKGKPRSTVDGRLEKVRQSGPRQTTLSDMAFAASIGGGGVININTWDEARNMAFRTGDRITITNQYPELVGRIFRFTQDWSPGILDKDVSQCVVWENR